MDFPLALRETFAYGNEEFRQVLTLLFKEQIGSFLQSPKLGATFSIHTDNTDALQFAVEHTLEQIGNVELEKLDIYPNRNEVFLSVRYQGRIENFQFEVETTNSDN